MRWPCLFSFVSSLICQLLLGINPLSIERLDLPIDDLSDSMGVAVKIQSGNTRFDFVIRVETVYDISGLSEFAKRNIGTRGAGDTWRNSRHTGSRGVFFRFRTT